MLLNLKHFFPGLTNILDSVYRGGWVGSRIGGFFHTFEQKSSHCVLIEVHRHATVHLSGRYGYWQQFDTKCNLISVPQRHHTLHIVDYHE